MKKYMKNSRADYKTNTQTAKELNITSVLDKLQEYRRNLLQGINKMPHNGLSRIDQPRGLVVRVSGY
jgi:hypothetical protein